MGTHQKLNYIHIFRAIAIIIIVAGHCFNSHQAVLGPICKVFLTEGTVLFVFIAGFLFQYLSDNFVYPTYLKKKFFNVVCPYLLTSVVGITILFLNPSRNPFAPINKIIQIPMFLTTGWIHNPPTWYIPMACIFFLCAAVLLKWEKKIIFSKYPLLFCLLPVLLLFTCLMPRYGRSIFITEDMSAWKVYISYLGKTLFNTALFFPVYILGMFFARYKQYIQRLYQKRVGLWVVLGLSSILSFLCIYHHLLSGRLLLSKVILTLLVLGYLEHYDKKIMSYPRINEALGIIATYSFSIFFFHYYFIMAFHQGFERIFHWDATYLAAETFSLGHWIVYKGILFLISLFGSLFLAISIKKILEKIGVKHTRYFIGT